MRLRWPALAAAAFTALVLVVPSVASAARRPLFAAMNGQNEIANGDHSFKVSGRGAPKPDEVLNGILDVVRDFVLRPAR